METNNIYILDSNVFIGAFFEGDSLHELSLEIFREIQDNKIILPYSSSSRSLFYILLPFLKRKSRGFCKFCFKY